MQSDAPAVSVVLALQEAGTAGDEDKCRVYTVSTCRHPSLQPRFCCFRTAPTRTADLFNMNLNENW